MTPSSLPLCASIGPRTASPTAQTLPAPVRHSSSTSMKPRSSSRTPVPSPSRPSVWGRRPIATTTLSTVTACSPLASVYFSVTSPLLATSAPLTLAPRRTSRPCFLKCRSASLATAWSAIQRNCSIASSTTTSAPSRRQTLPSSRPITPAPITPRRFGTASNSSAPQESTTCRPSNGTLRSGNGCDPEASTTCFAVSSRLLPSSAVNSTRLPASSLP